MAIHVPFSHRPSGRQHRPLVYIGFDTPRRRRGKFNWWGFNSILFFFLSLGLLSPITLLMGLKGLGRRPRKTAIAGTGLSLVGTGLMAAVVFSVIHHAEQMENRRYMSERNSVIAEQVIEVERQLEFAASEFEGYRDEHDGQLPERSNGNLLAIKHVDPWEKELMYEVEPDFAALRSAGADGEFFTVDDLTYEIDGETNITALLPVERE